jgi:zinc protease
VYAYKDGAVPLARVELVFRAGAISQGSESAGLFRLYERMLLRSAAARPGAASLKATLASLGSADWKGGVGTERSEYWVRLPAAEMKEGIAFWAGIFSSPRIDEAFLEDEKQAAIQDIRSQASDPDSVYEAGFEKRLFSKYPWRRDPAGSEKAVRAATLASLKAAVEPWLVPNNAAILVGGNVDPEEVRAAAEAAFGSWAQGPDPWAKSLPPNPRLAVPRPTWLVFPDSSMPEGEGRIEVRYRGPDIAVDPASSYAADLWSALVAPSGGRFKAAIAANVPKLADESIVASYASQRDGGWISISAYFDVDPALPAIERARALKERARGFELTAMRSDKAYFSDADYERARDRLLGDRASVADTAELMIGNLAFWWATASIEYYAGYPAAIAKLGPKEVEAFVDTYVLRNLEVVALRMNPADIEREKRAFASSGFQTVDASNAFWWQK